MVSVHVDGTLDDSTSLHGIDWLLVLLVSPRFCEDMVAIILHVVTFGGSTPIVYGSIVLDLLLD